MNANELRIGNWVYVWKRNWSDKPGKEHIQTVTSINENGINTKPWNDTTMTTGFAIVYPIPLTPEILEKAGFENISGNYHQHRFDLHYNVDFGDYRYRKMDGSAVSVTSVHQLQNLYFALTGEELKIDLS